MYPLLLPYCHRLSVSTRAQSIVFYRKFRHLKTGSVAISSGELSLRQDSTKLNSHVHVMASRISNRVSVASLLKRGPNLGPIHGRRHVTVYNRTRHRLVRGRNHQECSNSAGWASRFSDVIRVFTFVFHHYIWRRTIGFSYFSWRPPLVG